jgi:DNA-binding HxlR family transcriptional regulator
MSRRTYGQLCALARTLDLVGERWTLLVVRDLALAPRRFTDLQEGLPGIGTSLLSERLKHLEEHGLARRVVAPRPEGGVVYELTERGKGLAQALMPLARWGFDLLDEERGEGVFRGEWVVLNLRSLFRRDRAKGVKDCYLFRIEGEDVWAVVEKGRLEVGEGTPPRDPDFTLTTDVATFAAIGCGSVSPADALGDGRSSFEGDPSAEIFSVG